MNFKSIIDSIYSNKKLLLVSIFFASLFASFIFLIFFRVIGPAEHGIPNTDYLNCYKPFAENLLGGKGIFIQESGEICSPPGYPVILAPLLALSNLTGINELKIIFIFNAFLVALAVILLFLFSELIFGKRIALIASLLWLTYPFSLWFLKNPHTEVPFILFLYFGIWLYLMSLQKKDFKLFFLTGIILGLAALIRPIGFFLPFLFAPMIFLFSFSKKQILSALLILIGFILVILPWEVAVFSKIGNLVFLDTRGSESFTVGFAYALREAEGSGWPKAPNDVLNLMEEMKLSDINSGTGLFTFILAKLEDKTPAVLKLIALKMARSWYATSQMWWEDKIFLVQAPYILTALLGIFYSIKAYKEKIKSIIFLSAVILYFWGIATLALSILRYMVPAMGIMIIFTAVLLDFIMVSLLKRYVRK